ncbi:MAG: arginine--tRNA ligase [Bacilli bacterium]|nr:arginine--tRNA ligase [Bacilli bacterium]
MNGQFMDVKENLKLNIQKAFQALGHEVALNDIIIENSKDPSHGDYATSAAMKNCRLFSKSPRDVASLLIEKLDMSSIEKVEIAGPGFINFFMKKDSLQQFVKKIIQSNENYGCGENKNFKVNVEFVSANPTGDLHVGHARGAAIGDSISRILSFAGYDVTREYYINDAGNQIDHLAESILARYKQLFGLKAELPEDGYHGEDIIYVAKIIKDEVGDKLLSEKDPIPFLKKRGKELELEKIIRDLDTFRVHFDVFSSELDIRGKDEIEKEIKYLDKHIYSDGTAKVLKTTDYLDDKDRVIVKSNGEYTYFMPDIVYHVNKISRGFDQLIDVLGADHHGYINRMKSALMMHGYKEDALEVELIQMVRFIKDGVELKASKRSGDAITLKEICEDVGVDAMRYFFAMRAASAHMDFDMNLALEQSSNNPVYYAQYAHARLCSILNQGSDIPLDIEGKKLSMPSEMSLLKLLANFPNIVSDSAKERAPYKITNYIHDLAGMIHEFYTECRVIDRDNIETSSSRLALCKASEIVMKNALNLIGVSAPEHM